LKTVKPMPEAAYAPAQTKLSAWIPVKQYAISFVLPAYNEEGNITRAIETTVDVATRYCSAFEVIVVDDGSRDRTAELVTEAATRFPQVRLVRHARNRGYGEALRTGFLKAQLDFIFFTDADNQFDLEEIALLLPWAEHVDVVAGYRRNRQDPPFRRLNAWVWNRIVRVCFYVPVRDIDCAFKLFSREVLDSIDIESVGNMVNTEIMVKLGRTGKTVVEVGVTHLPRTSGVARGATPKVVMRALIELQRMYGRLSALGPGPAPVPPVDLR
jgi:glycosyltransferase involved in cell wall biosynthesis